MSDLYTLSKWMARLEVWVEVNNRIVRLVGLYLLLLCDPTAKCSE